MYGQTNQDNSSWEEKWQKNSTKNPKINKNEFSMETKKTEDAPGTQESYQKKNKKTQSIIQEK